MVSSPRGTKAGGAVPGHRRRELPRGGKASEFVWPCKAEVVYSSARESWPVARSQLEALPKRGPCVPTQWDQSGDPAGLHLDLPPFGYNFIARNEELQRIATLALRSVASGHLADRDGVSLVEYPLIFG